MNRAPGPVPGDDPRHVPPLHAADSPDVIEPRLPKPGDLVVLTEQASVQFAGGRSVRFRIISVDPKITYAGWVWLVGYVVDARGKAAERREVFVQRAGLKWGDQPMGPRSTRSDRPGGWPPPDRDRPAEGAPRTAVAATPGDALH